MSWQNLHPSFFESSVGNSNGLELRYNIYILDQEVCYQENFRELTNFRTSINYFLKGSRTIVCDKLDLYSFVNPLEVNISFELDPFVLNSDIRPQVIVPQFSEQVRNRNGEYWKQFKKHMEYEIKRNYVQLSKYIYKQQEKRFKEQQEKIFFLEQFKNESLMTFLEV